MADEDEIDILGEFSLDNLLSKGDSAVYDNVELGSHNVDELNCDCSSDWLLDHAATNSTCWYNSGQSDFGTDLAPEQPQVEHSTGDCSENQISTENVVSDESGWTKKEKSLLEKGIEIFGKSNVRLAQFIGTRSAVDVKHYLRNYYVDRRTSASMGVCEEAVLDDHLIEESVISGNIEFSSVGNEFLDDSEIPASIEEVIAVVSTAKPTVSVDPKKQRKNSNCKAVEVELNYKNIPSGHSILKSNIYKYTDQSVSVNTNFKQKETSTLQPKKNKHAAKEVKFKFRTNMKVSKGTKVKMKTAFVVPNINGEEVVKMTKEDKHESDSDLEIDVENMDDVEQDIVASKANNGVTVLPENGMDEDKQQQEQSNEAKEVEHKNVQKSRDFSEFSEDVLKELMAMETPKCELMLVQNSVTDLEKCFNSEFFEGRPTKTPERYLKIRNHILNAWLSVKPQYVTKTSIRPGLKNCGDVNSIGRIHQFLEQIGAINFGCAQTTYIRPLRDVLLANAVQPKEKAVRDVNVVMPRPVTLSRSRIKKKFTNDGEGGCTLMHDEKGDVINTTVVNEEPMVKQRQYIKKPLIRLIYCKPFTEEHPQKCKVHLHLSTLLLMDLHAHTSHTEVMGLIGGCWDAHEKTLTILRYVPCRNIASSATHCDMCPISQAKAADSLHGEGLNILGWFHSHPTFAPEPSQQDLDTQLSVQQWIGTHKPCIGLILSPFSAHGALIASPYRCLIVDKKHNFEDQYAPFKFKVELLSFDVDVNLLLNQAWQIFNNSDVPFMDRVDFSKPYFLDPSITYLDKFLSSIKMHLAKCSDINKMTCDTITEGFLSICSNQF